MPSPISLPTRSFCHLFSLVQCVGTLVAMHLYCCCKSRCVEEHPQACRIPSRCCWMGRKGKGCASKTMAWWGVVLLLASCLPGSFGASCGASGFRLCLHSNPTTGIILLC